MILPPHFIMRDGGSREGSHGYALRCSRDDEGLGVWLEAVRNRWGAPWIQQWTYDWLPGQVFPTLNALREAVSRISEDQIAIERANHPFVRMLREISGRGLANACAVCARETPAANSEGVVEVYLTRNWRPRCDAYIELCAEHRGLLDNPLELARRALGSDRP